MDREKVIKTLEYCVLSNDCRPCEYWMEFDDTGCQIMKDALALLKEQEAVVHPESSCEMTYITNCCCDLCGVQLIREDNFCRCCGKPIDWSK